jgi:hypothetical protein
VDEQGNKLFELEEFAGTDRMPVFETAIKNICNTEIMHGLLVLEKTVTEGTGAGSYAMVKQQADFMFQLQEDLATDLMRPLNLYTIPKLLAFNFPTPDPSVAITHGGLREADKTMVQTVIEFVLDAVLRGAPLTPEMIAYLKQATGVPIDARVIVPVAEPDARQAFTRGTTSSLLLSMSEPKLRRVLTEREKLLPGGGKRYLLSLRSRRRLAG